MDFYEQWLSGWMVQHPDKTPPTREQFAAMVEMFSFTPEELGVERVKGEVQ